MRSICAWCQQIKGQVPPLENPDVTHGICQACAVRYLPIQQEEPYGQSATECQTEIL